MGYSHIVFGQNFNFFIIQMNTVGDQRRAGEHAQLLQMCHRTQAVIGHILLHFMAGFGHMRVHRQVQIMSRLNKFHEEVRRTGVRRVRREHCRNSAVRFAVPVTGKFHGF
ncbi:hypothetical protein D3C80_1576590 [compost metagenome]